MARSQKTIALFVLLASSMLLANNLNTAGHQGLVRTLTVETSSIGSFNIGGAFKYDTDSDYARGLVNHNEAYRFTRDEYDEITQSHLFSGNLHLVYGLMNGWDFGIDLPMYHDKTGWDQDHTAFGNIELSSKLRYPLDQSGLLINQAYFLKVILPTGSKGSGHFPRHAYYVKPAGEGGMFSRYTSDQVVFNPMMIWTMHLDRLKNGIPLKLHVNLGGTINSSASAIAAVGLEYVASDALSLFMEISGESRVIHYATEFSFRSWDDDIFRFTPGLRYQINNGLHATLSFDLGIADPDVRSTWHERAYEYNTKGTPMFGVQLAIGWHGLRKKADSDKDGILNKMDKCPHDPEDMDKFQDEDGCPDIDNDNDGVLDGTDKCPLIAAVVDGCPVYDTDKDGILDRVDKCPKKPEDKDNFEDDDGCPDVDNDGDKIFDESDKCPQKAEDPDGFEDNDGCPELDNDGDGILDEADNCKNLKGFKENSGCPIKDMDKGRLILSGVSFQTGKAILNVNSYTILDHVIESLKQYPDIHLEVQGHTDNVGSSAINKKLSQARAEAVRAYMVSKGVKSNRLTAVGYGSEKPITSNATATGREKNRRVELKQLK